MAREFVELPHMSRKEAVLGAARRAEGGGRTSILLVFCCSACFVYHVGVGARAMELPSEPQASGDGRSAVCGGRGRTPTSV